MDSISGKRHPSGTFASIVRGFVVALALMLLLTACHSITGRVHRKHDNYVREKDKYLTGRIGSSSRHPVYTTVLSRREAEKDLDELEWLIENRYSYRDLKGVDYRGSLDSIRSALGDGISLGDFGYQLTKFIALFGDGHSKVSSSFVHLKTLCTEFLPFLVEESGGRLVAFKPERTGFVDPDFPFLRGMDGLPADAWLEAAGRWVAQGSPQYVRYHSIRNLRYVECLRKELGINRLGAIQVELESADGAASKQIELPLVKKGPVYGFWPRNKNPIKQWKDIRVESCILPRNIGYLRFVFMLAEPEFLDDLVETMNRFAKTDGLIIDIRTNSGGSRAPLRVLFPFFLAENDLPRVVNVAAYRLGVKDRKEAFEGRYLYPASSPRWSEAERAAINRFAATFQPEWVLPEGDFSEWHYFVISPFRDQGYFHYDKPVVILMDRWNFSACDIFLGAFKGWKNVILMGLPSGGGSGCRVKYRLRNSLISLYLSSMASFRPNGRLYDGKGIQPDVLLEPVPTDFIGETDTVLDAAIRRISRRAN